jgi:hypothetical protein
VNDLRPHAHQLRANSDIKTIKAVGNETVVGEPVKLIEEGSESVRVLEVPEQLSLGSGMSEGGERRT